MNKKIVATLLSVCFFASAISLSAQKKYWVNFTDKNGTPYSVNMPWDFVSQACIYRHIKYNIPFHVSDLPVNPSYVAQVAAIPSVQVVYASKWLNGVVVSVPDVSVLTNINALNCVASTSVVNRYKAVVPETNANTGFLQRPAETTTASGYQYGGSYAQNHQLGVDCLHEQGSRGLGITIAVLDNGFLNVDKVDVFDTLRAYGNIKGTYNVVHGGTDVYNSGSHGTMVLSCLAACKPGVAIGSAPMANYWLLQTEDNASEHIIEEYNWIRGAEFADSVGAMILTTSLGYIDFDNPAANHSFSTLDGKTAPMSIAATMAARKGIFVATAAGNEGNNLAWGRRIAVAADADSICSVGAVDSLGAYASFSGRGKTYDGRIKPDLVAVGWNAWICNEAGNCFWGNGTSFATPILAGAVACFMSAHPFEPEYNNIKILDTLKSLATKANNPDTLVGWGITNVCAIPVGINKHSRNQIEFSVYPNPVNSLVYVNVNSTHYKVNAVQLLNVLGEIIETKTPKISDTKIELNTSGLSAGIYFIKVNTSAGVATKKIIKQ
ncbi:MAG: S8 family peptidase [Bacteroidetes bacterium]|nr:S8 family peptidase [Bacteroidota bacterium]